MVSNRAFRSLVGALLLVTLMLMGTGCLGQTNAHPFIPLSPPSGATHILAVQQVKVGEKAQIMSVTSPHIKIAYRENSGANVHVSEDVGKSATEIVEVAGVEGTMLEFVWGDWENATLKLNEYFGPGMNVVRGMVTLEFEEASILQIFFGHARYTVDRSSLQLIYEPGAPGEWPVLTEVSYAENWGFKGDGILYGGNAVWSKGLESLLPGYTQWGFWEYSATPADAVANALSTVVARELQGATPDYKAEDEDSVGRELIGRQTGLRLYCNGQDVGRVYFHYKNNWGRQPNTPLIGKGALSRIEWDFEGQYYALVVLSPDLSPVGSSLYLFVDNREAVQTLTGANPVSLYSKLRNNQLPGVFYAVWAEGDIGTISSAVEGGEGGTVKVGDQGGVQFRVLGNSTYNDVALASNLMAMLGKAQKYVGLYYAYKPGSGSSLVYATAAMQLILADPERVLREPWMDVGVLDTVGVPNLDATPFTIR